MSYPAPIRHPLVEEYRCQDCGGPDGQRCQLLIEHDLPHIASVKDTFVGWMDGDEVALPPAPYRWAPSFPWGTRGMKDKATCRSAPVN
jgi:hypothetical protein